MMADVVRFPGHTDREFLEAVAGYARILDPEQEARISRQELERLLRLADR